LRNRFSLVIGFAEALLRRYPRAQQEHWKAFPSERLKALMRTQGAGPEHPSRQLVTTFIQDGESVLDVGCGTGVDYEVLTKVRPTIRYVGLDSSSASIEVARKLYPTGHFLTGSALDLRAQFETRSFDIVLLRHVLEHLSDFALAMEHALTLARRLAIFVFFLSPRSLPLGIPKMNPRIDPPFYTYVYSRAAIERFLASRGVEFRWYDGVGESRSGFLAAETNTILVVEATPRI
jgi:SAM-dependent methyltransferase